MDVGGTTVGGSTIGWGLDDPAGGSVMVGGPSWYQGGPGGYTPYNGGPITPNATGAAAGTTYMGSNVGFTFGGSWSPEPAGNDEILYGVYSPNGRQALPQAAAGQQLTAAAPAPRPAAPATVTVKAGDSLSAIAAAKGIDWKALYELNKDVIGSNANLIRPGQVLKLP